MVDSLNRSRASPCQETRRLLPPICLESVPSGRRKINGFGKDAASVQAVHAISSSSLHTIKRLPGVPFVFPVLPVFRLASCREDSITFQLGSWEYVKQHAV
jgi:hypothetical protein